MYLNLTVCGCDLPIHPVGHVGQAALQSKERRMMAERGSRPWMIVTDKGAFLDDSDDETQAKNKCDIANGQAKKLGVKTVYKVIARR
jgi:hypothetical protein